MAKLPVDGEYCSCVLCLIVMDVSKMCCRRQQCLLKVKAFFKLSVYLYTHYKAFKTSSVHLNCLCVISLLSLIIDRLLPKTG